MPEILINSLRANGSPTVRRVFKWDGSDDTGLIDYLVAERARENRHDMRDFSVDRSGVVPTLRYQRYERDNSDPNVPVEERPWNSTGDWRELPLSIGDWIAAVDFWSAPGFAPGRWVLPYYWECDERGRAFSIDDLVVP